MGIDEFSKENLCKGFTDEMKNAALKKFKINKVGFQKLLYVLRIFNIHIAYIICLLSCFLGTLYKYLKSQITFI